MCPAKRAHRPPAPRRSCLCRRRHASKPTQRLHIRLESDPSRLRPCLDHWTRLPHWGGGQTDRHWGYTRRQGGRGHACPPRGNWLLQGQSESGRPPLPLRGAQRPEQHRARTARPLRSTHACSSATLRASDWPMVATSGRLHFILCYSSRNRSTHRLRSSSSSDRAPFVRSMAAHALLNPPSPA